MSGAEFVVALLLLLFLIAVKTVNVFHQPFNSDEPQHLHVIWSWAQGLVQYRDVFDNHMPLFQIMLAPIAGLIGERAAILYWMRLLMLPMYFVAAWCTYQIGTHLFSRRAGLWSVIAVGWYPAYCAVTSEFRTDNLWALLWLLCLTVLIRGTIDVRRALVAGLLLGLCFGVSMKSTIFLLALLVSAPLAVALVGGPGKLKTSAIYLTRCAGVFLAGTILVPAVIAGFFAAHGVWRDFSYGVFGHQMGSSLYEKNQGLLAILSLILFPAVLYVARRVVVAASDSPLGFRRGFILLVACSYFLILRGFWPVISHDDYPPLHPLIAVLIVGALLAFSERLARREQSGGKILRGFPLPGFVVLVEVLVLLGMRPFWVDKARGEIDLVRDVLAVSTPRDYVFDCKGETIFRRRCFRPVLETISMELIRRGIMRDNIPRECIRTRTCVAATLLIDRLSAADRQFIEGNYVPVADNMRVAGVVLVPSTNNPRRCDFDVVIPAEYEIVSRNRTVSGTLDGEPYRGARFLSGGPHTFEAATEIDNFVLLWARAADRHFTPFWRNTMSDR
jgi:Dolichyl-phosphate-mannose-protein mannosyltransferase